MADKPYGSGYFGKWVFDENGLPAYSYTCNQLADERAKTFTNPKLRNPVEHFHQVGNDRVVAIASNFGYVQVRQDEGAPKLLNDYDPENFQYAGGIGYLVDGNEILCTFYGGDPEFKRTFGVGYFRKSVSSKKYDVDQVIFAPFGDDPLVISQVTVVNKSDVRANLRWVEYWGYQPYHLSFRYTIYAAMKKDLGHVVSLRRAFSKRFEQNVRPVEDRGIVIKSRFKGFGLSDKIKWFGLKLLAATLAKKQLGGPIKFRSKEIRLEDLNPPPVFLVSLDGPVQGLLTDARLFFGRGGVSRPEALVRETVPKDAGRAESCAMILEREFSLNPHERRTLYFAYGYLPEGYDLDYLIKKYERSLENTWSSSTAKWKENRIRFICDEPWVDRELIWHNYYLRSGLTYDTFFKEHIVSQGSVYQYIIGFQGAARDPLQHALPFIFTEPRITKEVIRYTLKEVQPTGEIPYAITGFGAIMPSIFKPSDLPLWLLWATSEYVLATRDLDFLNEKIRTYPGPRDGSKEESVHNLLYLTYKYLVGTIGTGKHGILRLSNGDWNDGVVVEYVPDKEYDEVVKHGESVLNSAMAAYVLAKYAEVLEMAGSPKISSEVKKFAEEQRKAVASQWNERWVRRAWLSERLGWVGDDRMWLEPQPWAIISGAVEGEQLGVLFKNIEGLMRRPSPIGAMLLSESIKGGKSMPGVATNGGIWHSINGTLVWALAKIDGVSAWDEWRKNTLAAHAEAYPEIWYGIWSGPDTYNSIFAKHPGATYFDESRTGEKAYGLGGLNWTDFPIMNIHVHAWPLYSLTKLLGIEFTAEGISIKPNIPKGEYSFESPLFGFKKSAEGYTGWYNPISKSRLKIRIHLPEEDLEKASSVLINGVECKPRFEDGNLIEVEGETSGAKGLEWAVVFKGV
jgi:hypothetical protein